MIVMLPIGRLDTWGTLRISFLGRAIILYMRQLIDLWQPTFHSELKLKRNAGGMIECTHGDRYVLVLGMLEKQWGTTVCTKTPFYEC